MFRNLLTALPTDLVKWCAYLLVLLAPGSFLFVPVWWLVRNRPLRRRSGVVPRPPSRLWR